TGARGRACPLDELIGAAGLEEEKMPLGGSPLVGRLLGRLLGRRCDRLVERQAQLGDRLVAQRCGRELLCQPLLEVDARGLGGSRRLAQLLDRRLLALERRCTLRLLREPLLQLGVRRLPLERRRPKLLELGTRGVGGLSGRRALELLCEPLLELCMRSLPGERSRAKLFNRRVPRRELALEC